MNSVFADTFYWIALTYSDDACHAAAIAFDASSDRTTIMTTEEILTEFLTFFGGEGMFLRTKALAVTKRIGRQDIRYAFASHRCSAFSPSSAVASVVTYQIHVFVSVDLT